MLRDPDANSRLGIIARDCRFVIDCDRNGGLFSRPKYCQLKETSARGRSVMRERDYAGLADACLVLALGAGRVQMRHARAGFAVETKADATPVTLADRESERLILDGLTAVAPDIPVIAEEESAAGRQPSVKSPGVMSSKSGLPFPLDDHFAVQRGMVCRVALRPSPPSGITLIPSSAPPGAFAGRTASA